MHTYSKQKEKMPLVVNCLVFAACFLLVSARILEEHTAFRYICINPGLRPCSIQKERKTICPLGSTKKLPPQRGGSSSEDNDVDGRPFPGGGRPGQGLDTLFFLGVLADKIVRKAERLPLEESPQFLINFVDDVKTFREALDDFEYEEEEAEATEATEEPEDETTPATPVTPPSDTDATTEGMVKRGMRQGQRGNRNSAMKVVNLLRGILEALLLEQEDNPSQELSADITAIQNALDVLTDDGSESDESGESGESGQVTDDPLDELEDLEEELEMSTPEPEDLTTLPVLDKRGYNHHRGLDQQLRSLLDQLDGLK